jgi:hypothetical protein
MDRREEEEGLDDHVEVAVVGAIRVVEAGRRQAVALLA